MPALTITAVNAATDQLTIVGHGLTTGDGFLAMYTPNGSIPSGLAPVTDYWAIRVDADHVKLATSSSNALAGTAIDITSTGSGTLLLLQGLPYRVPGIAAPGAQIKSSADNSTWGVLVALWNLLTGQAQSIWSAVTLAVPLTADVRHTSKEMPVSPVGGVYSAGVTYDQSNRYAVNSAASQLSLPILGLKVGDRINTVDFNHFGNASAYASVFTLNKMTAAGVASIVATSGSIGSPTGAAWSTYTLTVSSPIAIAAGEVWWLEWLPNSVVQRLQGANVKFDRP